MNLLLNLLRHYLLRMLVQMNQLLKPHRHQNHLEHYHYLEVDLQVVCFLKHHNLRLLL